MFTGIIEHLGKVQSLTKQDKTAKLTIHSEGFFQDVKPGDSVAVNGTCLTVITHEPNSALFDLGPETLARTTLESLTEGTVVNLELPLRPSDRLGGHFVQGHIDGKGKVIGLESEGTTLWMEIEVDPEFSKYLVSKGSIAIDGVSLTVAKLQKNKVSIMLMDYTLDKTNLQSKEIGDSVNVEFDVLAKMTSAMIEKQYAK